MPIFKYTVANRESKKLLGSIEAPDEKTARNELNNLGFSILELEEIKETESLTRIQKLDPNSKPNTKFVFEALNSQGQNISGTIVAEDDFSAFKRLIQEYELTVTTLWPESATEDEIKEARIKGTLNLQKILDEEKAPKKMKEEGIPQEQRKKELLTKIKIEFILKQVNETISEYGDSFPIDQRKEIDKRIDKLLRIKHSTNFDYIIQTAEDLLKFIQKQEIELKKTGHLEKRAKLILGVKEMLGRLHDTGRSKSVSEDIVTNIREWQQENIQKASKISWQTRFLNKMFNKIKHFLETPAEIQLLQTQIKTLNTQIIEYIRLYLKEPTKEYKEKTIQAIKTIWEKRKQTIKELKETKIRLKESRTLAKKKTGSNKIKEAFGVKIIDELTEFTGWLLSFYLIYYFVSLYVTSKDFGFGGIESIPKSLDFYNTTIFKYALIIVFLTHIAFTIKANFFKKTKGAGLIIFPLASISIIFVIVNF